jgi:hypothetical protein
MTLHTTVELMKKAIIWGGIGLGGIIVLVIFFQIGVFFKNMLFPPKIEAPSRLYQAIPALEFPKSATTNNLTYTLNTLSGDFPEFPDRLRVYPIFQPEPNFLNLNKAKQKVTALGFTNQAGNPSQEVPLGNANYEWSKATNPYEKIQFNIVNFDFILTSRYLSYLPVLNAQNLSDENSAIETAQTFLTNIALLPDDIDVEKTKNPPKDTDYLTKPQLFSIRNGSMVPTTSLSKSQVIRVDLYQKDIEYTMSTGKPNATGGFETVDIKLPILYPHPPYSTMNFFIGSGVGDAQVYASNFVHKKITLPAELDPEATYDIKTPKEAFDELKNGGGYIATDPGTQTEILINNIYLAYYMGEGEQQYLMPIIVFQGENDFFAYVSAVKNDLIKRD